MRVVRFCKRWPEVIWYGGVVVLTLSFVVVKL